MLKKIWKYDFKMLGRTLFPFLIAIVGLSALAGLLLGIVLSGFVMTSVPLAANVALISLLVLSFLGVAVCCVIVPILIFLYYGKTVFGREGYFTMTLPTTPTHILASKMLSGGLWYVIAMVGSIVCVGAAICIPNWLIDPLFREDFLRVITEIFSLDISVPLLLQLCLFGLCALLESGCIFYLIVTMGCTFMPKNKILGTFLFYLAASAVNSVYNVVVQVASTFLITDSISGEEFSMIPYFNFLGIFGCIFYLGISVGAFFLTRYLLSHKLNLE